VYSFCTDVFTILRSSKTEIQSDLVDLIGFENLELVTSLVEHRDDLVSRITAEAPPAYEEEEEEEVVKRPIYGTQVTVTTQKEKDRQKQLRKKTKRQNQGQSDTSESSFLLGFDGDRLREAREAQLQKNANSSKPLKPAQNVQTYPNVYEAASKTSVSMLGARFVLPAGTIREDDKDYEEISIPVSNPAPIRTHEKTITIDLFESWIHPAYKGYKSLNRVQSIVYPIAFETNENMLVCAPTGAGKTDVAMLTVLRCISQYRSDEKILVDDFKIVYVAPMKALAAEIVRKFSGRLSYLGIKVRELTGDMQLTKAEINETQMIVTTPEKWDVVTRKSVGDTQLVQKVKLLIIDEVHLLHEDRGAVIESIVARTLRMVESSQSMIRIVGLSATLPNYVDVAQFLGVNPYQGLFFFDSGFRPVPLEQHFVGIKAKPSSIVYRTKLNTECYNRVRTLVEEGHQVMVFVHSRKDTVKSAQSLLEEAKDENLEDLFSCKDEEQYNLAWRDVQKSRNRELKELFESGLGIHHAGMLRSDRTLTERMFEKGLIRVLCCTATLAWGVNLPAYAVIIKGTTLYNAEKGSFVDLSILDVLQIFGRAGRPQFEDRGVGYILTSHDKLNHYVSSMTQQHPIESAFAENLVNNLNAEISLGTITNMTEAVRWLSYTYLYVRMKKNPFNYGMDWSEPHEDPSLIRKRTELLTIAARKLHKAQMIVFDERTGFLIPKDLGRISSNFYIDYNTVEIINTMMRPHMTEADVLGMLSMSKEFENIAVRPEELTEMKRLYDHECVCDVKVFILNAGRY
jgi:replicative superfamily II helicase